jgi:hypothetical protein
VRKREDPFVLETAARQTLRIETSRKNESFYGVVISSTEDNKINTKVRIMFHPGCKIDEVMKSRLDFAEPPAVLSIGIAKVLEELNIL